MGNPARLGWGVDVLKVEPEVKVMAGVAVPQNVGNRSGAPEGSPLKAPGNRAGER
jgi:hypothetical protein